MPIERREIRLTGDELIQATSGYARFTPGVLPDGQILSVTVALTPQGQPVVTATVLLTETPDRPPIEVLLAYESLCELLIRFCRDEGIPMPRKSNKTAQVVGASLTLVIDQGAVA
jgi:hypothetical protein